MLHYLNDLENEGRPTDAAMVAIRRFFGTAGGLPVFLFLEAKRLICLWAFGL